MYFATIAIIVYLLVWFVFLAIAAIVVPIVSKEKTPRTIITCVFLAVYAIINIAAFVTAFDALLIGSIIVNAVNILTYSTIPKDTNQHQFKDFLKYASIVNAAIAILLAVVVLIGT